MVYRFRIQSFQLRSDYLIQQAYQLLIHLTQANQAIGLCEGVYDQGLYQLKGRLGRTARLSQNLRP